MPLPSFTTKTDGVTTVMAADVNNLQNEVAPTAAASAHVRYSTSYTSTANITLTDASMPVQSINATAVISVYLPAISTNNHPFYIFNRSTSTANIITVLNASSSTLTTINNLTMQIFISDSTSNWYKPA